MPLSDLYKIPKLQDTPMWSTTTITPETPSFWTIVRDVLNKNKKIINLEREVQALKLMLEGERQVNHQESLRNRESLKNVINQIPSDFPRWVAWSALVVAGLGLILSVFLAAKIVSFETQFNNYQDSTAAVLDYLCDPAKPLTCDASRKSLDDS